MGHDVVTIGRHTLNTSNVQALAEDIAQRMQANIQYGYQDCYSNYINGGKESTYLSIPLGEIKTPGAAKQYSLQDETWQVKEFYQQYGNTLFELEYFKNNPSQVEIAKALLQESNYKLSLEDQEEKHASIYADTMDMSFFYYSRWGTFCRCFSVENTFDKGFTGINTFRKNLRDTLKIFGENEMFYFDDQGPSAQYIYGQYTWQEILQELQTKFAGQVLNVSAFMKEKKLRKQGDFPLAFYDDFSDL